MLRAGAGTAAADAANGLILQSQEGTNASLDLDVVVPCPPVIVLRASGHNGATLLIEDASGAIVGLGIPGDPQAAVALPEDLSGTQVRLRQLVFQNSGDVVFSGLDRPDNQPLHPVLSADSLTPHPIRGEGYVVNQGLVDLYLIGNAAAIDGAVNVSLQKLSFDPDAPPAEPIVFTADLTELTEKDQNSRAMRIDMSDLSWLGIYDVKIDGSAIAVPRTFRLTVIARNATESGARAE
jgi:hypothetical protein